MKKLLTTLCITLLLASCALEGTDDETSDRLDEASLLDDDDAVRGLGTDDSYLLDDDDAVAAADNDVSYLGGGGCTIGSPNYPECQDDDDWPIIDQPTCTDYAICYCTCRVGNQCWNDSSKCAALAQCLNQCDDSQPAGGVGCPYPSQPAQPESIIECL